MDVTFGLTAVVLSGFVLAIVMPWASRLLRKQIGWVAALIPLFLAVYTARFLPLVAGGQPVVTAISWVPQLGINLGFYLDGLSLLMVLIISGIGTLIFIYAGGYLQGDPRIGRFYVIILIILSGVFGYIIMKKRLILFKVPSYNRLL